jgi:hypothetical protein
MNYESLIVTLIAPLCAVVNSESNDEYVYWFSEKINLLLLILFVDGKT